MKVLDAIETFLKSQRESHNGPDLLDRWTSDMETQVNVHPLNTCECWHIRIPKHADKVPEFRDSELPWAMADHVQAIGCTGWNWWTKRSLWFGFDFDSTVGHAKGLSPVELEEVRAAALTVSWVEVRKSTSGTGLHFYVRLGNDGIETENHTVHAELGKFVLSKLASETGFPFDKRVDCAGGNMWIWSVKATRENEGFKLIKAAECLLGPSEIPAEWRDSVNKKPDQPTIRTMDTSVVARAMAAMLKIRPRDDSDGSRRLYAYACRCVEHDLNDEQTISAIRGCEAVAPFPRDWSNAEIEKRIRDAEKKVTRGQINCDKPEINLNENDLQRLTKEAWTRIAESNTVPTLYRFGGLPVRIERDDNEEPIVRTVGANQLRHHLAEWIRFTRTTEKGTTFCPPPMDLVLNVLATPEMPLPILERVTEAPVFAADGTLQTSPGYHPESRTLYSPKSGFVVPAVSAQPTALELEEAKELIRTELLGDFPFTNDSERAHAVALLLLPFARGLIGGLTPLHLFEKPAPGTGATLLVEVLTLPALGRPIAAMTEGRCEEEWRKRITAKLRTSPSFIMIDNLRATLDSGALASAITSPTWEDRLLGESSMLRLPVRAGWIATGNNPRLTTEIARRTVRIRLDAKRDKAWLRTKFRHPDLKNWATVNRGQLVWAALTIIQGWIAAERPLGDRMLGNFESWSGVMGGILKVAGIPGFLANLENFYEGADSEGAAWRGLLASWWQTHESKAIQAKDLFNLVEEDDSLELGTGNEQSRRIRFGQQLAGLKDRVFEIELPDASPISVRVDFAGKRGNATVWSLAPICVPSLAA